MREQFVIEGNHQLQGEVTVSGNKNAALKMLPESRGCSGRFMEKLTP